MTNQLQVKGDNESDNESNRLIRIWWQRWLSKIQQQAMMTSGLRRHNISSEEEDDEEKYIPFTWKPSNKVSEVSPFIHQSTTIFGVSHFLFDPFSWIHEDHSSTWEGDQLQLTVVAITGIMISFISMYLKLFSMNYQCIWITHHMTCVFRLHQNSFSFGCINIIFMILLFILNSGFVNKKKSAGGLTQSAANAHSVELSLSMNAAPRTPCLSLWNVVQFENVQFFLLYRFQTCRAHCSVLLTSEYNEALISSLGWKLNEKDTLWETTFTFDYQRRWHLWRFSQDYGSASDNDDSSGGPSNDNSNDDSSS